MLKIILIYEQFLSIFLCMKMNFGKGMGLFKIEGLEILRKRENGKYYENVKMCCKKMLYMV